MQRALLFILQPSKPPRLQEGGEILLGGKEDLGVAGPLEGSLGHFLPRRFGSEGQKPSRLPRLTTALGAEETLFSRSPSPSVKEQGNLLRGLRRLPPPACCQEKGVAGQTSDTLWPPVPPKELGESQDANFCGHQCGGEGGFPRGNREETAAALTCYLRNRRDGGLLTCCWLVANGSEASPLLRNLDFASSVESRGRCQSD